MANELTYNNVKFDYVKTTGFDQSPIFSDDGMDYLYTYYRIQVEAVFNAQLPNAVTSEGSFASPAKLMKGIRDLLMTPRKGLVYKQGVDEIIKFTPSATITGDAKNGPFPKVFSIKQVCSPSTFIIIFEVEGYTRDCEVSASASNTAAPVILSNRWTVQDHIDGASQLTTRTTRGTTIFLGGRSLTADSLRSAFIPMVEPKFTRQDIDITESSDGLKCHWVVTDKETYVPQNPSPVTHWEGEYEEQRGESNMAAFNITVWGDKNTEKGKLLTFAIQVMFSRVNLTPRQGPDGNVSRDIIISARTRESLHENKLSLSASVLQAPVFAKNKLLMPFRIGRPIDVVTNANQFKQIQYRGSLATQLVLAKLKKENCDVPEDLARRGMSQNQPYDQPTSSTNVNIYPTANINVPDVTLYSDDQRDNPYTQYDVQTQFHTTNYTIPMPIASSNPAYRFCAFVTLAQPTCTKEVRFTVERYGEPPELPAPNTGNTDEVLLYSKVMPMSTVVTADGITQRFYQSGSYFYAMTRPPNQGENLSVAATPNYRLSPRDPSTQLLASDFVGGIIA